MIRQFFLLISLLILAGAATGFAQDEEYFDYFATDSIPDTTPDLRPEDIYERLDRFGCTEKAYLLYKKLPDYFYYDDPDSLVELLGYWDDHCGMSEPLMRLQILGSIWDGAFSENIYDSSIIDYLLWRYDSVRQEGFDGTVYPYLASGGVATSADFVANRKLFDSFTKKLSDQLLPHIESGTLEEFFCLYYSGKTKAAWDLLESGALEYTDLGLYYRQEIKRLGKDEWVPTIAATAGWWSPRGNLSLAGDHQTVGFLAGVRHNNLLLRFAFDVRLGRANGPYNVIYNDDSMWSDRFSAFGFGVELGSKVVDTGRHQVSAFVGIGMQSIKPFRKQELWLNSPKGLIGLGYRFALGKTHTWFVGADWRQEWVANHQAPGTKLDGKSGSFRIAIGVSLDRDRQRRLEGFSKNLHKLR